MTCIRCKSERIAEISSKSSDLNSFKMQSSEDWSEGYVPHDMGIGGGDYTELAWCLNCGQIQGTFPLPPCELEDDNVEYDNVEDEEEY